MKAYRGGVLLFAMTTVGLGVAIVVVTALHGGGVGYVIGALFVAAGVGRIYLLRR
jgi:hypothetical protein